MEGTGPVGLVVVGLGGVGSSLITGLLFGLIPALQASRVDLIPALKDQLAIGGYQLRSSRLRSALVVGQLALSVLLLIVAGFVAYAVNLLLKPQGWGSVVEDSVQPIS